MGGQARYDRTEETTHRHRYVPVEAYRGVTVVDLADYNAEVMWLIHDDMERLEVRINYNYRDDHIPLNDDQSLGKWALRSTTPKDQWFSERVRGIWRNAVVVIRKCNSCKELSVLWYPTAETQYYHLNHHIYEVKDES